MPTPLTPDSTRRRNLGRVLDIVHREGTVPRSAITRATGLNRSTVAALVQELTAAGLVREGTVESEGTVGRPSSLVTVAPDAVILAIHPEIDAVDAAFIRLDGTVHSRARRDLDTELTPERFAAIATGLRARLIAAAGGVVRVLGTGIAVPGLVNPALGVVRLATHLGWTNVPLVDVLAAVAGTGNVVIVDNDANLAARAEFTFGAGRAIDDLIYLNGGASGIGGGIVLGGRAIRGVHGYAGELGHGFSSPDGASLDATLRRDALVAAAGGGILSDAQLGDALRERPQSRALVTAQTSALGVALAGMMNAFDPARVVLGGFLAVLADLAPEVLAAELRSRVLAPESVVLVGDRTESGESATATIVPAQLGADRLLIGCAEAVIDVLIADPLAVAAHA